MMNVPSPNYLRSKGSFDRVKDEQYSPKPSGLAFTRRGPNPGSRGDPQHPTIRPREGLFDKPGTAGKLYELSGYERRLRCN